jgi:hypothetical protein
MSKATHILSGLIGAFIVLIIMGCRMLNNEKVYEARIREAEELNSSAVINELKKDKEELISTIQRLEDSVKLCDKLIVYLGNMLQVLIDEGERVKPNLVSIIKDTYNTILNGHV